MKAFYTQQLACNRPWTYKAESPSAPLYLFMPNILPQDDIDLELCALLGIDLAMKEEVSEEHEEDMEDQEEVMKQEEDGMKEQDKEMEEQEEGTKEQEEGVNVQEEMEMHNDWIQEQEKIMEEQEERMEEETAEEVLGVTTHRIKHAIEENILLESVNDAAKLKSEHSQKSPQVGAKKECYKKKSSKRTQLTKGLLSSKEPVAMNNTSNYSNYQNQANLT